MRFNYDKETDALYIHFLDTPGVDSYEVHPDYIADIDEQGNLVGLEILNIKGKMDFSKLIFDKLPIQDIKFINEPAIK